MTNKVALTLNLEPHEVLAHLQAIDMATAIMHIHHCAKQCLDNGHNKKDALRKIVELSVDYIDILDSN